jgi:hypothetical protein
MKVLCSAALATVVCLVGLAVPTSGNAATTISFETLPITIGAGEVDGSTFNAQGLNLSVFSGLPELNVQQCSGRTCLSADFSQVNDRGGTIQGNFVLPGTNIPAPVSFLSIKLGFTSNPVSNSVRTEFYSASDELLLAYPGGLVLSHSTTGDPMALLPHLF